MIEITLPCGKKSQIDDADAVFLHGRRWFSERRGETYYLRGRLPGEKGGGLYFHKMLISGTCDHIDGNGLNNTRKNLRPCSQHQNLLNKRPKRGKVFKGVYQRGKLYYAQCYFDGVCHSSFGHQTQEDAAVAYDEMAKKYHGSFARLNFQEGGK